MKYIKKFENHNQYNAFTATTDFILPNVSTCIQENDVHYNPSCKESDNFIIIGEPSYPSEIEGTATSFDITVHYRETHIGSQCQETIVDEGTDTITVECGENPSTSASRTVSGTVDYHSNEIEYSVTQSEYVEPVETRVVAKFNVTGTSSPTKIASATTNFSSIEIDGVEQSSVITDYTFSTTGEHTVKYTLTDQTTIDNKTFIECSGITSIVIPDSVTTIGSAAFQSCKSLTSVTIGNGVTSIGNSAFTYCNGLTRLNSDVDGVFNLPSGVTSIGNYMFHGCSGLTSIDIPSGVTYIGSSSFYRCTNLTSIAIPDSVTSIGGSGFSVCTNLTSINIPSGVTKISDGVFNNCKSLTSIIIPSGVTSIGWAALAYCSGLTSITSDATTAPTIYDNTTFQNIKKYGTLYVPVGSSGYDTWLTYLSTWTKVEH